jgi:hypothetical protein
MRGKNSGKRRKDVVKKPHLGSWINRHFDTELAEDPTLLSRELACTNQVPRQVASDWALFWFSDEIKPFMVQNLFKCKFLLDTCDS